MMNEKHPNKNEPKVPERINKNNQEITKNDYKNPPQKEGGADAGED